MSCCFGGQILSIFKIMMLFTLSIVVKFYCVKKCGYELKLFHTTERLHELFALLSVAFLNFRTTTIMASESKEAPASGAGTAPVKRFEVKKWNAVALWAWGRCTNPLTKL